MRFTGNATRERRRVETWSEPWRNLARDRARVGSARPGTSRGREPWRETGHESGARAVARDRARVGSASRGARPDTSRGAGTGRGTGRGDGARDGEHRRGQQRWQCC